LKTVIVTGDNKGLGLTLVTKLVDTYKVLGISRSDTEDTNNLTKEYDNFTHINYDVSNYENIKTLYLENIKDQGPIYGLVNNAGMAYDDIITNANTDKIKRLFEVNTFSAMMLTKYAIRDMLLNDIKGSIIHVSSVCAHTGYKGLSMYSASKGALESFSRTVAREWGERGIRSNCIAPGFMETNLSSSLTELQRKRIYRRTSLKKETNINSVANTIEYLLSEESASITGTTISVDNGTI